LCEPLESFYFQKPSTRILHYDFQYPKELPFSFQILNPNLHAIAGENFELRMQLKGQDLPSEAFVIWMEEKIPMENIKGVFRAILPIGSQNQMFQFQAGSYFSEPQTIDVIQRPAILQVEAELIFPTYVHRSTEKTQQFASLEIPEGTKIRWLLKAENEQGMLVQTKLEKPKLLSKSLIGRAYLFEKRLLARQTSNLDLLIRCFQPNGLLNRSLRSFRMPNRLWKFNLP